MPATPRALVVRGSLLVLAFVSACAPGSRADDDPGPVDEDPDAATPDARDDGFVDAAPPPTIDSSVPPPDPNGAVYGHSSSRLYKVDPQTYAVTPIADFVFTDGSFDSMTDIAVDRNGVMTGVSFTKVYRVDPATAACTYLAPLDRQFNGLSYVPGGPDDPAGTERLVGTTLDGSVWRIDPATGATTQVGHYGGTWTSSGDLVYVEGFGAVATVKQMDFGPDFLASIDLTTFAATPIGTGVGWNDIWGLGFWEGKIFGFSGAADMVLVDPLTGTASLLQSGAGVYWWGAGVTTAAPVIP